MAPPKKQRTPRLHGRPDKTESIPQRRQRNPVAELLPPRVPAPHRSGKDEDSQGKRKDGCGGGDSASDGEIPKGVPCGQCHSTNMKLIYGANPQLRNYLCNDCQHRWVDFSDELQVRADELGDNHHARDPGGSPLHPPLLELLAALQLKKSSSIRDVDSFLELDLNKSPPPSPPSQQSAKGDDNAPHLRMLADVACEMAVEEAGISLKVVLDGRGGFSSEDQNRIIPPPAKRSSKGKEKLEFEPLHAVAGFDQRLGGTTPAGDGQQINNPPGVWKSKAVAHDSTAELDDEDHPMREPEGCMLHSLYLVVLSYTEDGGISIEDLVNYFHRENMTAKWPYNWEEKVRVHLRSNRYFKAHRRRGRQGVFVVSADPDQQSSQRIPKEIMVPRRRRSTNQG